MSVATFLHIAVVVEPDGAAADLAAADSAAAVVSAAEVAEAEAPAEDFK